MVTPWNIVKSFCTYTSLAMNYKVIYAFHLYLYILVCIGCKLQSKNNRSKRSVGSSGLSMNVVYWLQFYSIPTTLLKSSTQQISLYCTTYILNQNEDVLLFNCFTPKGEDYN